MAEYIERESAIRVACNGCNKEFPNEPCEPADCYIQQGLFAIPAADVAPVRHGEWKFSKDGSGTCNQCGFTQKNVWDHDRWQNYCGVCGAKMDGKGDGE